MQMRIIILDGGRYVWINPTQYDAIKHLVAVAEELGPYVVRRRDDTVSWSDIRAVLDI